MKNASTIGICWPGCPVPTQQIHTTRANYPNAEIYYEIQIEFTDIWQALLACGNFFADSGLYCMSIRYAEGGTIFIRLKDTSIFEPTKLELNLGQQLDVHIQSWVTMICFASPKLTDSIVEIVA